MTWHTEHQKRIQDAAIFLNRNSGSGRTDESWSNELEVLVRHRARFLRFKEEYRGRTLEHPPVGTGHTAKTTRCPDQSCPRCPYVSDRLPHQMFPEFSGKVERGCFVGWYKLDPLRAMRRVYVHFDARSRGLRFALGRYTAGVLIGPETSVKTHTVERADVIPSDPLPCLVTTVLGVESMFRALRTRGCLPPAVQKWQDLNLSNKEVKKMHTHLGLVRGPERDRPVSLVHSGYDPTSSLPTFSVRQRRTPRELGSEGPSSETGAANLEFEGLGPYDPQEAEVVPFSSPTVGRSQKDS